MKVVVVLVGLVGLLVFSALGLAGQETYVFSVLVSEGGMKFVDYRVDFVRISELTPPVEEGEGGRIELVDASGAVLDGVDFEVSRMVYDAGVVPEVEVGINVPYHEEAVRARLIQNDGVVDGVSLLGTAGLEFVKEVDELKFMERVADVVVRKTVEVEGGQVLVAITVENVGVEGVTGKVVDLIPGGGKMKVFTEEVEVEAGGVKEVFHAYPAKGVEEIPPARFRVGGRYFSSESVRIERGAGGEGRYGSGLIIGLVLLLGGWFYFRSRK